MPLPEREDAPGSPGLYHRGDLGDLPDLIAPDAPMALVLDCEAIARAFFARVRRVTDEALEVWSFTPERGGGA